MNEIPDFPVARVKNMGAVGMDVDAFDPFRVAIAADVAPLVDQKAALALSVASRAKVAPYSPQPTIR